MHTYMCIYIYIYVQLYIIYTYYIYTMLCIDVVPMGSQKQKHKLWKNDVGPGPRFCHQWWSPSRDLPQLCICICAFVYSAYVSQSKISSNTKECAYFFLFYRRTRTLPQLCICMCAFVYSAYVSQSKISSNTGRNARVFRFFCFALYTRHIRVYMLVCCAVLHCAVLCCFCAVL